MNTTQKIIKALAIALAVFIIFNIVAGIFGVIAALTGIEYLGDIFYNDKEATVNFEETFNIDAVSNLKIESGVAKINIINSDVFKVEANNVTDKFKCELQNDTLVIKEKEDNQFNINLSNNENTSVINIYVPEKTIFNTIDIDMGVGNSIIEALYANNVELTAGVGNIEINYLAVQNKLDVESGVGILNIKESYINNLEFEAGVGEYTLNSKITGRATIESGVGDGTINLKEFDENSSRLLVDKGIGNIKINGNSYLDNQAYGQGSNLIEIDGGIGNINITIE